MYKRPFKVHSFIFYYWLNMIIYANEMVLISTKNMLNPTEIGSADLDDDDGDGAEIVPDRDSAEP